MPTPFLPVRAVTPRSQTTTLGGSIDLDHRALARRGRLDADAQQGNVGSHRRAFGSFERCGRSDLDATPGGASLFSPSGDPHHGQPFGHTGTDHLENPSAGHRIQMRRRLVGEQQLRFGGQRRPQRHQLLAPCRQGRGVAIEVGL